MERLPEPNKHGQKTEINTSEADRILMIYKELDLNSELMRYLQDKQVLKLVLYQFKRLIDELISESNLKNKK